MLNAKLVLIVGILAVFGAACNVVSCQGEARTPHRYLIPSGYVGWIRVDFEVNGTPEISLKDGFYVFRIPKNGLLRTSSTLRYGVALDEYYYELGGTLSKLPVTRRGAGGMIWAGFNGSSTDGQSTQIYEYFFVGTEEEFEKFGKPALKPGEKPPVGNVKDNDPME